MFVETMNIKTTSWVAPGARSALAKPTKLCLGVTRPSAKKKQHTTKTTE
jgi:hypothetical protein